MSDHRTPTYNDVQPVEDIVTTEECGELVAWLDTTPPTLEDLLTQVKMAELCLEHIAAQSIAGSRETSADKRKAEYQANNVWFAASKALIGHQSALDRLKHEISLASKKVELYRTLSANRRARDQLEKFEARTVARGHAPSERY